MTTRRRLLLGVALGILLMGGAAAWLRRSFRRQIDSEIAQLLAAQHPRPARMVTEADLEPLPPPVQRWLRASGVVGTAIPAVVRLQQEGEFRLGANKSWMPFHATEYFTIDPPGLLWNASMEMAPLVEVTGRDRYVEGTGDIEMRIASLYPVARKSGGHLNSGALLRYLNETMWFPAALVLPTVTWEPIDDIRARATLTDARQSVSAVFHFDDQDRLVTMTADRWNDSEQAVLPWSTPLTSWDAFDGITIPAAGSGIWKTGADAYAYIRLRVTNLAYDPV
jgi:hypothetical protein